MPVITSDMDVYDYYEQALRERGFKSDYAQRGAVHRLQKAYDAWIGFKYKRSNRLKKIVNHPDVPRGIYLWGGVGRGKSFLMDSFYLVVPVVRKTRLHFHEFMRDIHRELDKQKDVEDPLQKVAQRIARKYRLICFDEFHVSDIADAMILYNLLQALFDLGVSFVMTSNYEPEKLYPDGLHRDRILPAIALLKDKLDIVNVDAGVDYRQQVMQEVDIYHQPLGEKTDATLSAAFSRIADRSEDEGQLKLGSRTVKCVRRAGGVVWFNFAHLCGGARSQNDYLEIAQRFHTVILSDIPQLTAAMASEARRFTWLIDILYDHRVKCIMSAAVAPELLYVEGTLSNEFHRTVSRIIEMQSLAYKESGRRQAAEPIA